MKRMELQETITQLTRLLECGHSTFSCEVLDLIMDAIYYLEELEEGGW